MDRGMTGCSGNLIKELRKDKSLTQEQLAEQFGVARRTVSRRESVNFPTH